VNLSSRTILTKASEEMPNVRATSYIRLLATYYFLTPAIINS
jgi:hypothetical protein